MIVLLSETGTGSALEGVMLPPGLLGVLDALCANAETFVDIARSPSLSLDGPRSISWNEFLRRCTSSFFTFDVPTAALGGALIEGGDEDLPRVFEINFPPRFTLSLLGRSALVSSDTS
jgi:hypothetical protein